MRLDDVVCDRQAKSAAAVRARTRLVRAVETLEHMRQVSWLDADTRVGNGEYGHVGRNARSTSIPGTNGTPALLHARPLRRPGQADIDSTSLGCIADGVLDQVGDQLLEAISIAQDDAAAVGHQRHAPGLGPWPRLLHHLAH